MSLAHPPAETGSLQSGQDFACILSDDPQDLAVRLEAAVDAVADLRTRFVTAGNPLRAPLTVERLLIQAAGNDAESYYDRTAEELTRIVVGPWDDETRVVLVIEQAETLDPEAVRVLREMAACSGGALPKLQVLFAGGLAFQSVLEGRPAPAAAVIVAEPEPPPAPDPAPDPTPDPAPEPEPFVPVAVGPAADLPPPVRRSRRGAVLLLIVLLLAVLAGLWWHSYPGQAAMVWDKVHAFIQQMRGG